MKKQSSFILIAALVLMAGTAAFLGRLQAFQKLGQAGVKVAAKPIFDPDGKVVGTNVVDLPERVLDCDSEQQPIAPLVLNWLPKDTTYGKRIYKAPNGFQVQVDAVLMGADRTSIHKPQYCLTGQGWVIGRTETDTIPITQPHPYDLSVAKLTTFREFPTPSGTNELRRGIYVYWFVADNQLTADHLERMWWMARDMVRTGVLQRWAYVACFSGYVEGQEAATYSRMKEFIAAAVPQFQLARGVPNAQERRP